MIYRCLCMKQLLLMWVYYFRVRILMTCVFKPKRTRMSRVEYISRILALLPLISYTFSSRMNRSDILRSDLSLEASRSFNCRVPRSHLKAERCLPAFLRRPQIKSSRSPRSAHAERSGLAHILRFALPRGLRSRDFLVRGRFCGVARS